MIDFEKYFQINEEAFYINDKGEKKFQGVHKYYGDTYKKRCGKKTVKSFAYSNL